MRNLQTLPIPEGSLSLTTSFLVGGLAVLGISTILAPRSNSAPNLMKKPRPAFASHTTAGGAKTGAAVKVKPVAAKSATTAPAPATTDSSGRRSIAFYTGDVRDTMFSEPIPPPLPAPVKEKPPVVAPVEVDPWANWSVTGIASVDGTKIAFLENIETHDTEIKRVGDEFLGRKIVDIDPEFGVGVQEGKGKPHYVLMSMLRSYTPLSKSADFMTAQPQQNQANKQQMDMQALAQMMMGMNNGQGNGYGGRGNRPNYQFPGPNGQPLNGNAARQYRRNLNRNFNSPGG